MEALLNLGLGNAVAATILALGVGVAARLVRRPSVVHALWLLVLLKLVTPPLWPVAVHWPAPAASADVEVADAPLPLTPQPLPESGDPVEATEMVGLPWSLSWQAIVVMVWLSGSGTWWALATLRLRRFRRVIRQAVVADEEVTAMARQLARRMGLRCPPVWMIPGPISPLLLALGGKPCLLLPAELWARLSRQQQETLVAHELAHLKRRDHWVRRLELLVLGLYWWLPAAWYAQRRLQEAEEECCDALVVATLPQSASAYAEALLETVSFLSSKSAPLPATASGASAVPLLKRRLTMILLGNPSRSSSVLGWAVLCAAVVLLPLWPTRADPPDPPAAEPAPRPKAAGAPVPAAKDLASWTVHGNLLKVDNSCVQCHTPPGAQDAHFRLEKEPKWQAWHKEAIALLEQERALRQPPKADHAAGIQAARDEVELLQAQLEVKKAQLQAAEINLRQAELRFQRVEQGHKRGVTSATDFDVALAEVENGRAQAVVRRAEIAEPEVRLRQAQRRLTALQKAAKGDTERKLPEERLEKLERDLRKLLEEMRALQDELRKLEKVRKRQELERFTVAWTTLR